MKNKQTKIVVAYNRELTKNDKFDLSLINISLGCTKVDLSILVISENVLQVHTFFLLGRETNVINGVYPNTSFM